MQLRTVPNNNEFTNAPTWTTTTSDTLEVLKGKNYNIYSTAEPEETLLMGGKTIWYRIYPTQGGTFSATVDPYSEGKLIGNQLKPFTWELVNPEMTIWSGTNITDLTLVADSKIPNPTTSVTPYEFPNTISTFLQASNSYYLRIDATEQPGEFTLTRKFSPKAANDNFADAIRLASIPKTYNNGTKYLYHAPGANFAATTEA